MKAGHSREPAARMSPWWSLNWREALSLTASGGSASRARAGEGALRHQLHPRRLLEIVHRG